MAVRVAPLCGEFYSVYISSKTIESEKENLAGLANARLTCADILFYEFGLTFDVVYSSLTFTHIEDKQRAASKIAGLLNDAGRSKNVFELCKGCPFVKCCKERSVDSYSKCPKYLCKEISDYQAKYVNKCN